MSDMAMIRIGILIAGLLLVAAIFLFGRPKKSPQGRRVDKGEGQPRERREPVISSEFGAEGDAAERAEGVEQSELNLEGQDASGGNEVGKRPNQDFDKIVSLFVAAKAGQVLRGEDVVVVAEKTGLVFGHMNVFHRLVEGHPERGPIFSMASILKPGSFDMANIREMQTPAIAFFLTLPAPMTALDAWEKMLPTVQRMAELLDGVVLDDSRNALGRQRVAHIRDELRAYDRQHQAPPLTKSPRW
ncbi:cell division protein ZipA [Xanthomonas citri pv. citri]|uniref:Cell division protein ZipA n=2 Tax=Xanthomonas citri pv. citri TaxID=611301 RepID=ZIPA_XANAC|nr:MULTISPECIES: cell division protein ZipA [Xanthomonas]Q8PM10.1 RecName: Full=Cell division protein ZipA [Xanthomonas citri pv. citri str. 306]AAM36492.1 cell division protein [Xanthomonas citri pv. citri str. 306]AGH77128.1 cell division protein ZipA [Xanthomonas axonopodis Xac29-1]AJD68221.1 cell division protein ZipA [Xanthomonas citri subsp. citri A306]AJY81754.1 cell division protein ZipA [Xanthomonas citri pv. citri]AJY86176.1 cell division protein ZipA [Xanthomonas citri subsp. citri